MTRGRFARLAVAGGVAAVALASPAATFAHQLSATFESRLPLAVYLAGAAGAVALSFAFVLIRDVRAAQPPDAGRVRVLPVAVQAVLRVIGVIGLAWIVAQGIVGHESDAEVSRLFAWVYGWVGVALVSAFVFPVWRWLDPFSTIHLVGSRLLRAAGISPMEPVPYPVWLGRWPAVIGFAAVVWLELVAAGAGSRTLALVITGYAVFTLAMMAQYGREAWSENAEIFGVWFGLLNRLAPFASAGPASTGGLRRRGFATGLMEPGARLEDVVLVGLGTASILFDGLSQTQIWVSIFGLPATLPQTALLAAFLAIIVGAALAVSRLVGVAATVAGLVPIAIGYLLAHYFTYLVIDGQRIVIAISDPLQLGADLFGTAFFQPSSAWLPPGLVWTIQLAAVVGGHMIGAWAGHVVAARRIEGRGALTLEAIRVRQLPLAVVMVGLTTLTLWSLGQALFIPAS